MANRDPPDMSFDDDEECCPLCVEEFDLSDKNFKPCPCGYQVCQFCYNNIKNNMNGLCPACRRPYDDKNIEWKIVSPEEFKADIAAQARKKAAVRQKEAERRQVEHLNRKHLAGLRVLQKNLVYVLGMSTSGSEEDLELLKGPRHFGQYGKIVKIVASKAKEGFGGPASAGIYVTFASKDDARDCIAALDGTAHGGRMLKAQYGTTKYCSAFLRNEVCNSRHCTFLHETGDEGDSFSRQDLSSLNAVSSQRPVPGASIPKSTTTGKAAASALPALAPMAPIAQAVKSEAMSRSDSGDGSALPTSASWAKNPQVEQSRRSSQAPSRASPSPRVGHVKVAHQKGAGAYGKAAHRSSGDRSATANKGLVNLDHQKHGSSTVLSPALVRFEEAVRLVTVDNFKWSLDRSLYDEATLDAIDSLPPLIDPNGGAIRYAARHQQDLERQKQESEQRIAQVLGSGEEDDVTAGGSLQLGGEPDGLQDRKELGGAIAQAPPNSSQATIGNVDAIGGAFSASSSLGANFANMTVGERSLTPQPQRNFSLFKSSGRPGSSSEHPPRSAGSGSQHQSQLSNPFQSHSQQYNALSKHGRQTSRFAFANETSSPIKGMGNDQLLNSSNVLPSTLHKGFPSHTQVQPNLQTSFYSGVQGPPPGLKSNGTPPISGGGMFGQGHGFANSVTNPSGASIGNAPGKGGNEDLLRDIIRGRTGSGLGNDSGKQATTGLSYPGRVLPSATPSNQSQEKISSSQANLEVQALATPPADATYPDRSPLDAKYLPHTVDEPSHAPSSEEADSTPSGAPLSAKAPRPRATAVTPKRLADKDKVAEPPSGIKRVATPSVSKKPSASLSAAQATENASKSDDINSAKNAPREEIAEQETTFASGSSAHTTASQTAVDSSSVSGHNTPWAETHNSAETAAAGTKHLTRTLRTLRIGPAISQETLSGQTSDNAGTPAESVERDSKAKPNLRTKLPGPNADTESPDRQPDSASTRPSSPLDSKLSLSSAENSATKAHVVSTHNRTSDNSPSQTPKKSTVGSSVLQEPIVGRKKKSKGSRAAAATASPSKVLDNEQPKSQGTAFVNTSSSDHQLKQESRMNPLPPEESKTSAGSPLEVSSTQPPVESTATSPKLNAADEVGPEQGTGNVVNTSALIRGMVKDGTLDSASVDLFLNALGSHPKIELGDLGPDEPRAFQLDATAQSRLDSGGAVKVQMSRHSYAVVSPDRSVLRYLSSEEADRCVQLRDRMTATGVSKKKIYQELPTDGSLSTAWTSGDDGHATGMNDLKEVVACMDIPQDMAQECEAALADLDAADTFSSYYSRRSPANEGLAERIAHLSAGDSALALKTSEAQLAAARKETEALEKKLGQLLKKNRRALRDWA